MALQNTTYNFRKASIYRYKRPSDPRKATPGTNAHGYGLLSLRCQGYGFKDVQHCVKLIQHHACVCTFNIKLCNGVSKLASPRQNDVGAHRMLTDLQYQLRHVHNAPCLGQEQHKIQKVFTVIRSPFVYKKTREQFGLKKHTKTIDIAVKRQHINLICHSLSTLTLPCELKIALNA